MKDRQKNQQTLHIRENGEIRSREDLQPKPSGPKETKRLIHALHILERELEARGRELSRTQEELESIKVRYSKLYDFAPVACLAMSSEKEVILEANLTAAAMLGVARESLLNHSLCPHIVSDDRETYTLHRQRLLQTGEKQSSEIRLQRADGSVFHALMETALTAEDGDSARQCWITVSDISIHKEAELAKLQHLKDRYRAIVMDQNDLICRFDPQGRITFVNDAYCRYFGVGYKEILGTNFLPNIHKDDLPLVEDHFKNLSPDNPGRTIEHRVHLPEGRVCWQQWCGRALYDRQGKVIEYQAVGRDITRLKEAKEQLKNEAKLWQLFLNALPCFALLIEFRTRMIVASNKAATEVGAVAGKECYSTWMMRESPCPWCLTPELRSTGKRQNCQFWAHDAYWDAYWVPVDEDHYLHYVFDSTEKQKNKEALQRAHEELEQKVNERTLELQKSHAQLLHSEKLSAVGSLSASIAHEFNNPLQSVMTIIKGIGQYVPLEKKEEKLIALALQECRRMKDLIANLRDFYRPSSGRPAPVDLHATLDALLLISKKEFHNRQIAVVRKYAWNIPSVTAVQDQLKQVFLNLFNNAADACKDGGTITLATERIRENVAVHVTDNGVGISPANIPHIFEPFFTTKSELKGTGLGLSVSYGIIMKHGGRIEVKSEAGKGSTFSVILPIKSISDEQEIDTAG